jgi:hypothetical protein
MSFRTDLIRGLREMGKRTGLDGRTPQTFEWNEADVPCVANSVGREVVIDAEGNPVQIDLRLFVTRDNFLTADSTLVTVDSDLYTVDNDTPIPLSGMDLVFRGKTYVIVTAKESGPQSHFELTLGDSDARG